MSTFENSASAQKVWFEAYTMWIELTDGRSLGVPLAYFPRLLNATPEQRLKFEMSGGGTGLHWDDLDEDISSEGLLSGIGDRTSQARKKAIPL